MIVTLTGPSCAGKSTLEKALKQRGFSAAISHTTRKPREGEVDGQTYYFVDQAEFLRMQEAGEFVETIFFGDNFYGLHSEEMERLLAFGKPIVVVCEPVGQKQIAQYARRHGWPLMSVFVDNPADVIAERFLARFALDVLSPNCTDLQARIAQYSRRLATIMGEEQTWRLEARSSGLYTLKLPQFNEDNFEHVVDVISRQANLKRKEAA